jgi:hypothetical protein
MRSGKGPWASQRTPRGTRPPKIETPQTVYRRHPKHRQRPEAMEREDLPAAPAAAAQDSPHDTHLSVNYYRLKPVACYCAQSHFSRGGEL